MKVNEAVRAFKENQASSSLIAKEMCDSAIWMIRQRRCSTPRGIKNAVNEMFRNWQTFCKQCPTANFTDFSDQLYRMNVTIFNTWQSAG